MASSAVLSAVFGDDRGLQALGRGAQIVVDDDVVVEILAFVDLVDRLAQAQIDLLVGVQAALAQPHPQRVQRRREDENAQRPRLQLGPAICLAPW
jgi:chloramphenicol 3-O-phosphotransferase